MLWRMPRHGGDSEVVFSAGGGQLFDVIGDGDDLFFTGNVVGFPTVLDRIATTGGDAVSLLPSDSGANGTMLALDDEYVYFLAGGLSRVARRGGAPTMIAPQADVQSFATDGANVYYTEGYNTTGTLTRASAGGGDGTVLVSGTDPGNVAVDRGAVYYTTCQNQDAAAIWIMAK
jgi:hypothetical protein